MSPAAANTIILITGATSGVGLAATKVIASALPSSHVIMASRSQSKLDAAYSSLSKLSPALQGGISTLLLDVTDQASITAAVAQVAKRFGGLDVLINNAAIGNRSEDLKTRMSESFVTNVLGPALVAEAFRPLLLKSEHAYSVYVSSGQGSIQLASETKANLLANAEGYRVSKAALNMLAVNERINYGVGTESGLLGEGEKGLKVFVMCPGFVRSNLRGTDEESVSGWGKAGDPEVSGQVLLEVVKGERDGDIGGFVHEKGVYPW